LIGESIEEIIMIEWLLNKYLPVYIHFWLTDYWLAMWSAPIRFKSEWRINGKMVPCYRWDTYWQAFRITIRKGPAHSKLIRTIKKGTN